MRTLSKRILVILISISAFAPTGFAEVGTQKKQVAKVITTEGKVTAYQEGQAPHEVTRGSPLFEEEWINVAESARADILEADGTVVSLLEKSKFHLTMLTADPDHPETYRNISSLAAGGVKVISGSLSKLNPDGYALKTPVATIGIRGTIYLVSLITRNNILNMDVALMEGRLRVTQRNAAFVSDKTTSTVSKELVTLLEPGEAIRATSRTLKRIRPNEVYGYPELKSRTQPQDLDIGNLPIINSDNNNPPPPQQNMGTPQSSTTDKTVQPEKSSSGFCETN